MALEKLMLPSVSFCVDKINHTLDTGLSRIELSVYSYSYDEFQQKIGQTDLYFKKV